MMQSPPGPRVRIDGRDLIYFAGTGYLGLQGDPRVIEAACKAVRTYGVHPATSRSGFGESLLLVEVEQLAARYFGAENALYFVSGYAGMATLVQAADEPVDLILADAWLHLAGQDAALLSRAKIERFRHGDPHDLRDQLRRHAHSGRTLVLCDGVSPVRGDIAPVNDYLSVIEAHGSCRLVIDDAHGVGVLGANGRGTIEHASDKTQQPIPINLDTSFSPERQVWMCGTLSKALGGSGGVIPGSSGFISGLKAGARWYHGAAASPAPVAGATAAALDIVWREPELRRSLNDNVRYLRSRLRSLGLEFDDWPTPIICLRIGSGENMARIQKGLMDQGIVIAHSRNYAGVDHEGALRIAVFATHTTEMIDALIDVMRGFL